VTDLPAPAEVLAAAAARLADAYRALGDARDQLRGETSGQWSAQQAARKRALLEAIRACKHIINEVKR
jgi:hypothetical protein